MGNVIERIPGVRGAHSYLYQSAEGLAVVDPGYTGSFRAVLRFLTERRLNHKDLEWVILTHHHIDHAGTAFARCEASAARLAVHRDEAPYLRGARPRERMPFRGMVDCPPSPPRRTDRATPAGSPRRRPANARPKGARASAPNRPDVAAVV